MIRALMGLIAQTTAALVAVAFISSPVAATTLPVTTQITGLTIWWGTIR